MPVKAKFNCENVLDTTNHFQGGSHSQRQVTFRAVYANGEENNTFSKATPQGELKMVIDKETIAYDYFKPGKSYYLTLEEANQ